MTYHYLWTPWRMQYITGDGQGGEGSLKEANRGAAEEADLPQAESTGCVFCDRARMSPEHDRANLVLLRGERNFVILNLYPYNSAHLMVVPYLHTSDFASLDAQTTGEMTALLQRMLRTISQEYKPEGFNMGMNLGRVAGAGVADHVHMHLVPRWAGDTNFMPVVGQTKVMPELLETTYDRLKARLKAKL
jgi:ATP adenylyltransferase